MHNVYIQQGTDNSPYDKNSSCDKTLFRLDYLRFTMNDAVTEKDGSSIHDVFYLPTPHRKS